jgi:hypothetical protein
MLLVIALVVLGGVGILEDGTVAPVVGIVVVGAMFVLSLALIAHSAWRVNRRFRDRSSALVCLGCVATVIAIGSVMLSISWLEFGIAFGRFSQLPPQWESMSLIACAVASPLALMGAIEARVHPERLLRALMPEGTCKQCGYDTSGLAEAGCPECGYGRDASQRPE